MPSVRAKPCDHRPGLSPDTRSREGETGAFSPGSGAKPEAARRFARSLRVMPTARRKMSLHYSSKGERNGQGCPYRHGTRLVWHRIDGHLASASAIDGFGGAIFSRTAPIVTTSRASGSSQRMPMNGLVEAPGALPTDAEDDP